MKWNHPLGATRPHVVSVYTCVLSVTGAKATRKTFVNY